MRTGAVDGGYHAIHLQVRDADLGQVGGGEGAAPKDVAVGELGPGALHVVLELQVAGVVQEHGRYRQLKVPGFQLGGALGAVVALKKEGHADGRHQRVTQVVVFQVYR